MALQVAAAPEAPVGPQSRLARNITVLTGSQVVTWVLSMAWTVVVPRALGPKGLGQMVLATSFTAIVAMVIGLGTSTLLVKEIAADHSRAPRLIGNALILRMVAVAPALAVTAVYLQLGHFGNQQTIVILLAMTSTLFVLVSTAIQAGFQGIERMEYLAYGQVLTEVVVTALGIGLVYMGQGLVTLMALWAVMAGVTLALNLWWRRKYFAIDWRPDRALLRHLVTGSTPYWLTGLVLTVYIWIDSQMLSFMTPIAVVGWYGVPTKLFNNLLFVAAVLATASLPRFVVAHRQGREGLRAAARPSIEMLLMLSLPVSAGTALIAERLVWVLYGSSFGPAVPVLVILAFCIPPTYLNIIANQYLIAANRQTAWTKVMVAGLLANPVFNLVMIPALQHSRFHNGAIGAALSLLATELLMAGAAVSLMNGVLNRESLARLGRAAVATAGMAGCVWLSRLYVGFALQVVVGMVSFSGLALLLRLPSSEEVRMGRMLAARIRRRPGRREDAA